MRGALTLFLLLFWPMAVSGQDDRSRIQQGLDAACEAARTERLAPLRRQYIDDCVRERGTDRAACERFYADFGARSGNRAPLFYDLPECEEAFNYRRGR